jgi:uncharacterized membrane protein YesL
MKQFMSALGVIKRSLIDWWYDWVNMVLINIVWAFGLVTIILAPPTTLGAFYAINRLTEGRSIHFTDFIEGFRRYFWLSYAWALVNVAAAVLAWSGFLFYGQLQTGLSTVLMTVVVMLALGWFIIQFFALPYLIEQEQKNLLVALRNSLFTGLASPLYTVIVVVFSAIIVVVSIAVIAPIFLGGPCLIALLANHAVRERLITFGIRPQPENEVDQYPQ